MRPPEKGAALDQRRRSAGRAAKEIKDGFYVNLGIGVPTRRVTHLQASVCGCRARMAHWRVP